MSLRSIMHDFYIDPLRKIGADIKKFYEEMLLYISLQIGDTKLSYMYYLNTDDKYYVARIKPFSIPLGSFNTEEEVVNFLMEDIKRFKSMDNQAVNKMNDFYSSIIGLVKDFEKDLFR